MKITFFLILVFLVFYPVAALADSGPDPLIFSLEQDDQDVAVRLYDSAQSLKDATCTLLRRNNYGEHVVIKDAVLTEENLDEDMRCYGSRGHAEHCEDYPDECIDCDGDGHDECATECRHFMMIVDECVPAGNTRYIFRVMKEHLEEDEEIIKVRDAGVECSGSNADADGDFEDEAYCGDDGDEDNDDIQRDDEDDEGVLPAKGDTANCSVGAFQASAEAQILPFFILLIPGLFFTLRLKDR